MKRSGWEGGARKRGRRGVKNWTGEIAGYRGQGRGLGAAGKYGGILLGGRWAGETDCDDDRKIDFGSPFIENFLVVSRQYRKPKEFLVDQWEVIIVHANWRSEFYRPIFGARDIFVYSHPNNSHLDTSQLSTSHVRTSHLITSYYDTSHFSTSHRTTFPLNTSQLTTSDRSTSHRTTYDPNTSHLNTSYSYTSHSATSRSPKGHPHIPPQISPLTYSHIPIFRFLHSNIPTRIF